MSPFDVEHSAVGVADVDPKRGLPICAGRDEALGSARAEDNR
jgi:hypothetical protein